MLPIPLTLVKIKKHVGDVEYNLGQILLNWLLISVLAVNCSAEMQFLTKVALLNTEKHQN